MKYFKNILLILVILVVLFLLILALYYSFSFEGDTATMVAGLWSALATGAIGAIAIFQSRQYKKLSDKATEDYQQIQTEIRNLTNNMVIAVETLKKIEKSKYLPSLEQHNVYYLSLDREDYQKIMSTQSAVFQINYFNVKPGDHFEDLTYLANNYPVLGFAFKNIGEKTIINFIADSISSTVRTNNDFIVKESCDVKPGDFVYVLLVNIPDYKLLNGYSFEISFKMNNFILETFIMNCTIHFDIYDEMPQVYVQNNLPRRSS